MKQDTRRLLQEFLGGLMVAAGAIISILSGLCTAAGMFFDPGMAIAFGALPFMFGVGLWIGGAAIYKSAQPPRRAVLPQAHFGDDPPADGGGS